ncbi:MULTISPECIES: FAD binding domain-containing protein [Clostridium]|uniref:FAD binding domain-containing protein n=1 Tax=Clostridium TaxID=1485 RepID=UPI002152B07C|nr:FAD binding domain-containing protein [Clostridium sp. LY3-2]MCR6514617.1 FAD binding domain-containing protein [Clostridium sp. LY3-2]
MFTIKEYVRPESLDEAYKILMKNKKNAIIGGMLWMRLGKRTINVGIDLSHLGLDKIIEREDEFEIGSMVTLRELETDESLNLAFQNIFKEASRHIVGVQFRNLATVGGSIYSRFGFSDVLTAFLVLDCYVVLHNGGKVSILDFNNGDYERDIIEKIIIKKNNSKNIYLNQRLSETDLPIIAMAVSKENDKYKIAVGARPSKAELAKKASDLLIGNPTDEEIDRASEEIIKELDFGSNMRASKEYREYLSKVFLKRALDIINGGETYDD